MTVNGVAIATVIANVVSSTLLLIKLIRSDQVIRIKRKELRFSSRIFRDIIKIGLPAGIQSAVFSVANIIIQSAINSLGTLVIAASSAAFNIEILAYYVMNAFSQACTTFTGQNYGAGQHDRLRRGFRQAVLVSAAFSAAISLLVCVFAAPLMRIFVQAGETEVLAAGVRYLRIEGACYVGIGCLFLLYGFYRAVKRPGMSVVLTVISLGVRVLLAYLLAGPVGEVGIWLAIPIGWALADLTGFAYYARHRAALLPPAPTAAVINLK